jgi:hypothetical protein
MERIVVYTETLQVDTLAQTFAGFEIVKVASMAELSRAVVERSRVIALIIEKTKVDEAFQLLLFSINKSFPILQICLVARSVVDWGSSDLMPAECRIIMGTDRIHEELKAFVSEINVTERRDHPRFDWPLKGDLSIDDRDLQTHNIWALSAEGAFLESQVSAPAQRKRGKLSIRFQNSRLLTECEVLDRRPPSSRLPAGFAVRFTEMSEESTNLIDRIIQDALMRTLLEPESEPGIPSLDEEDLSIPGFESL